MDTVGVQYQTYSLDCETNRFKVTIFFSN